MIRSMTGFGSAELQTADCTIKVEVRSVNHKGLRVSPRVPDHLAARQHALEETVREKVHRGHVFLNVDCEARPDRAELSVDMKRLKAYARLVRELAREQNLDARIDAASLLLVPGVVGETGLQGAPADELWEGVLQACRQAVDEMVERRQKEGANLQEQIEDICRSIQTSIDSVEAACDDLVQQYRRRLQDRVQTLLQDTDAELDEATLSREVAVFAEKSDVSEEITRLRSHLDQFRATLEGQPQRAGKKLGFLAQEMLREANTMAAKMPGAEQTHQVVGIKTAVDRLREQIRNVE